MGASRPGRPPRLRRNPRRQETRHRREHMDRPVHEGDEGREGGDGPQRHLLGFFRRICKLLYLRARPVFVFDGGTPALKRRTVAARRRSRDAARAKIRKTAEKLLLNQLKARRLEELADEIKNSKWKDDPKGKKVVAGHDNMTEPSLQKHETVTGGFSQESLDEMLAASLAAEEEDTSIDIGSTSVMNDVQDDDAEDEEMVLPILPGKVDPTVLAALPPSMQLDLLVQMRESLMAENRQKYQKIKKAPKKFSELQIQSYLKTVAFRREIDEVQKAAAGKGLGGVQPSRIASEANREFIFSSSFTGDKQVLTSARLGKDQDGGHHATSKEPILSGTSNSKQSACQFSSLSGFTDGQPTEKFDHSVGTYRDESGRFRVSRLRGLGIRMTRDLEQNLRLIKELEQERIQTISTNKESTAYKETYLHPPNASSEIEGDGKTIGDRDAEMADISNYYTEPSTLGIKSSIEISFEEDDSGMKEADDDDGSFFERLVEGSSTLQLYAGDISTSIIKDKVQDCKSDDDKVGKLFDVEDNNSSEDEIEWEEETCHDEIIKDKDQDCKRDDMVGMLSTVEDDNNNEDEVEWEEGTCHVPGDASLSQTEYKESVLRTPVEEEADIQEAIRRSLLDFSVKQSSVLSSDKDNLENSNKILTEEIVGQLGQGPTFGIKIGSPCYPIKSDIQQNKASSSAVDSITVRDNVNDIDNKQMINSPKGSLIFSAVPEVTNDRKSSFFDEPNGRFQVLDPLLQCQETPTDKPVPVEPSHANEVSSQKSMEVSSLEHEVVQKSAPEQVLVINRGESVSSFEEFQSGDLKIQSFTSKKIQFRTPWRSHRKPCKQRSNLKHHMPALVRKF
ncbi:DNA repair protein UVH3 [Acorus calamus]|uniref:DNA repair protein UVH3 n=1 Tax=Acorus calamus TaxID=4465 RepID=A0AAV9CTD3_ACOCL|nr:DNA repair protein UVH3 [Acorus calamus]